MTTNTSNTTETVHYCARHPDVETELACGKCGTMICPRCMVQTPVGARCRDCAQLRRPVQYTMSAGMGARIAGAAVAAGVGVGLVWGLVVPGLGAFGFFLIFLGMFAGYGMANLMDWAGGRKRGTVVQLAAVAGIVLAYLVRNLAATGAPLIVNDIWGLVFVGIATVVAWNQLR